MKVQEPDDDQAVLYEEAVEEVETFIGRDFEEVPELLITDKSENPDFDAFYMPYRNKILFNPKNLQKVTNQEENEDAPERAEIHSEIYKAFSQVEELTDSRTATSKEILEIAGLENVGERAEAAFDAVASELNWQSPSKAELEERNRELIQMGVAYSLRWFKFNQTDQLSFPEKLIFLTDSPDISSEAIDFDKRILKEEDKTVLEDEFRWELYADESLPHIKLIFDGVSGYVKSAEHIKLGGAKVGFDEIGYSDHGM